MTNFDLEKYLEELDSFLETLKIHNKDLDVCFDDALAKEHIRELARSAVRGAVEEIKTKTYEWETNFILDKEPSMCGSDLKILRDYLNQKIDQLLEREHE